MVLSLAHTAVVVFAVEGAVETPAGAETAVLVVVPAGSPEGDQVVPEIDACLAEVGTVVEVVADID